MDAVAIAAALAAAACYAGCSVLQHAGARRAPRSAGLRFGLFRDLLHQPLWVVGTFLDVVAAAFQALALHYGPLSVVQPLLVLGLLLVVPLAAAIAHRRPRAVEIYGAVACVAGLAVFLGIAQPGPGTPRADAAGVAALLVTTTAAAAGCVVIARHRAAWRATWLAAGAGLSFAVSATALKLTTDEVTRGVVPLVTTWPVYALAASAAVGMLLNQHAFQAGSLPTPMAVMTIVEPVAAVAIGTTLLHEHLSVGAGGVAVTFVGLAAMAVGIGLLAHGRAERDVAVWSGSVARDERSPSRRADSRDQLLFP